jgi:hypothetical protein
VARAIAWKTGWTAGKTAATEVKIAAIGARTFGMRGMGADSAIVSKTGGIGVKMAAIGVRIGVIAARIAATDVADGHGVVACQGVSPRRLCTGKRPATQPASCLSTNERLTGFCSRGVLP